MQVPTLRVSTRPRECPQAALVYVEERGEAQDEQTRCRDDHCQVHIRGHTTCGPTSAHPAFHKPVTSPRFAESIRMRPLHPDDTARSVGGDGEKVLHF